MRCTHLTSSGKRCKNDALKGKSACHIHAGEVTLFEKLGGIVAIAAVVNDFSDNLLTNPIVGKDSKNPQLRDWSRNHLDRLPFLKFGRTLWLASISGGPYEFVSTKPDPPSSGDHSLHNPHAKFHITSEEFDAVAQELAASLDRFKVPKDLKKQVLNVFAEHKAEVINPK